MYKISIPKEISCFAVLFLACCCFLPATYCWGRLRICLRWLCTLCKCRGSPPEMFPSASFISLKVTMKILRSRASYYSSECISYLFLETGLAALLDRKANGWCFFHLFLYKRYMVLYSTNLFQLKSYNFWSAYFEASIFNICHPFISILLSFHILLLLLFFPIQIINIKQPFLNHKMLTKKRNPAPKLPPRTK